MTVPFMEHPSGDFETAIDAMTDAIARVRSLPFWSFKRSKWINISAQGMGAHHDATACYEIRMRGARIEIPSANLNLAHIAQMANLNTNTIKFIDSQYDTTSLTAKDTATFVDAVFRHHFGLQPFPDENNDYAVGFEWER